MKFNKVAVIGLGYIGLPTAAVLASRKIAVIGVDVQEDVVATINQGQIHIVEPDLDIVVKAVVAQGFLRASTKPEPADAFLIAVPTPFKDGHAPDLKYVEAASRSIAGCIAAGNLIILESTSPVGTTEKVEAWLAEERPDLTFPSTHGEAADIRIAHCPERVLPGHVLTELIQNDRVIGGLTPACSAAATELYRTFVDAKFLITNARTAEMCKLVENSFRDVNIAFANELSILCDQADINVWELIALANHHPRVSILQPGTGVGGHCIAVDPWFIVSQSPANARLIRTAREVNDHKPDFVVDQIKKAIAATHATSVVLFGLTFKPDIDDIRESPALAVARRLSGGEFSIRIVEPNIAVLPATLADSGCELITLEEAGKSGKSVWAFLVGHKQFKGLECRPDNEMLDFCGVTA